MENEKNFQPEMNQNEVDKTEEISNESEALSIDEDVKLIEEASDAVEAKQENTENDDFDWDALLKETREYKEEERKKLEEKYTASMNVLQDKEVIEGTVIGFGEREVFVNINYKSDGVIPLSEVRYNPDLKIGDKIEVYVESQDDGTGQLILSHKKLAYSQHGTK
ncbi:MAG: S1 RNA-binding domain-containing protein [Bacteroidales bacterium]|nr:S1 RNA-binding domain-containing protein [Bacteroidales bacterium]